MIDYTKQVLAIQTKDLKILENLSTQLESGMDKTGGGDCLVERYNAKPK